jgi:hypothetical protein
MVAFKEHFLSLWTTVCNGVNDPACAFKLLHKLVHPSADTHKAAS